MSIFSRFFGKSEEEAGPAGSLTANPNAEDPLSLQILFSNQLRLDSNALTKALQSFHRSISKGRVEIDDKMSQEGKVFGLAGWGKHVIRLVGFDLPMPPDAVEACVAPSHYPQPLKEKARAHAGHVLLFYVGYETTTLEQYVALAALAGVLSRFGAIVVLNESAHTSFPAGALDDKDTKSDILELIRTLPLLILFCGFVKYEVQGVAGVWMRTYGAFLFGLPDLAILAKGHHEGERYFELFENILAYLRNSGARFAAGHTMQVGEDQFLRVRAPTKEEYFLESDGELFVAEIIGKNEINR